MTNYTQANPFEFEGVKVWRDDSGIRVLQAETLNHFIWPQDAPAIYAFIEAERMTDTWTEQPDGTWRKGRWVVTKEDDSLNEFYEVSHDDFPGLAWSQEVGKPDRYIMQWEVAMSVLADFLTFHAAHTKAEFTPLTPPEVGQWGEFTLHRAGTIFGEVVGVNTVGDSYVEVLLTGGGFAAIILDPELVGALTFGVIAWHPTERPQPSEPMGKHAVVLDNGGWGWVRNMHGNWISVDNVAGTRPMKWAAFVQNYGPVTVESPGVEL